VKKAAKIIRQIAALGSSSEDIFNPYRDHCPSEDNHHSPTIRKENLFNYFSAHLRRRSQTIWVFEAPGYRGCRRTGLPLISENLFETAERHLRPEKPFKKATRTGEMAEYSANAVWKMVAKLADTPLIWNAYPLHPFKAGDPLTNRTPKRSELTQAKSVLESVLSLFNPEGIVAVGRVAEKVLREQGVPCIYVRHPANGGIRKFQEGVRDFTRRASSKEKAVQLK
jgi:uracil-DNA glycosylase